MDADPDATADATADDLRIALVEPARAGDRALAERVASMVCDVYEVAEAGLWVAGTRRTTPEEIAALIGVGELALATVGDELVGSAHVHPVAGAWSVGMLVAAPERRGLGIGRELLRFGERVALEHDSTTAQVELLVPRSGAHPEKVRLAAWYDRAGYVVRRLADLGDSHPHLAPFLATPCDLEIRQKPLAHDGGTVI